jgi:D-alanyl-D-alanine carboxypeptidase
MKISSYYHVFIGFIVFFGLYFSAISDAFANPRYASIILEESSGKVLFSRNADKQLRPASLTKIMTLYLMFEALQQKKVTMGTRMKVSRTAASRSPSKLYLKPGHTITVKNAILALVTKSANDVATVVAEHLGGGSEREFARKMTRKAKSLGMSRTIFRNASGLPHSSQYSTARDMARLGMAVRRDFPQYFHYFSRTQFNWNGRKFKNHNRLLKTFQGTDGIKTGYTNAAGFNLVATAERNGVRLIGVVFGGKTGRSRDKHMVSILGKQFKRVKTIQVKRLPTPSLPAPRPAEILQAAAKPTPGGVRAPVSSASQPATAPLSVAAPPRPPRILDAPPQQWSIQVGSFSRRISAHKAAISARRTAGTVLTRRPAQLSLVIHGQIPLWRVQFRKLEEDEARAACAALFSAGSACIALPDNVLAETS